MNPSASSRRLTGDYLYNRFVRLWPFPRSKGTRAFTRVELLAVLAALGLLACWTLPGLANTKPRSERIICVNNLRQVGLAYQTWATDHGDMHPTRVRYLSGGGGGTQGHMLGNKLWFQFACISNQLGTPRVLACPSDRVRVARDFSGAADGGFLHSNYRDNALSYLVSPHAYFDFPLTIVSGDYNWGPFSFPATCSSGIYPLYRPDWNARWTNNLHGEAGNIVLTDGRVLQLGSAALQPTLWNARRPEGSLHLLMPVKP